MKLFVCVLIVVMLAGGAVCVQAYSDIMDIQIIPDVQMITPVVVTAPVKPDPVDPLMEYVKHLNDTINRSERIDGWDCVDYSIDFAKNNPTWGIVTISRTRDFCPNSHMINYVFHDNDTLIIYDSSTDDLYYDTWWQIPVEHAIEYYHFWVNEEQPVRNYRFLRDNREQMDEWEAQFI